MPELACRQSFYSGHYWHFSDPGHSIHVSPPNRVQGTRSLFCTVREDWPNGRHRWMAIAHVEIQAGRFKEGIWEDQLKQHCETEDEALELARAWIQKHSVTEVR